MSLTAAQQWWIRADGNDTNGGGYDASVASAGTNYSDQASPQLSVSDIVTTGTTTVTSVTGGFTSQMIGNLIFIGGDNRYCITAVASTNSITVDKATGTGTAQTGKVGGALLTFQPLANGGSGTGIYQAPAVTSRLAPGHQINLRGSGVNDGTADYTWTSFWTFVSGTTGAGCITLAGYNGHPCMACNGLAFYNFNYWRFTGLKAILTASTFNNGFIQSSGGIGVDNCIVDLNGQDSPAFTGFNTVVGCYFKNTGSKAAGTVATLSATFGGQISGNEFNGIRGYAINLQDDNGCHRNIIIGSNGTTKSGITITTNTLQGTSCTHNTIDSCAGDAIQINDVNTLICGVITNNEISNNGRYGLNYTVGAAVVGMGLIDYNNYYNNTSGAYNNIAAAPHDTAVNPNFKNSGAGDYNVGNAALQGTAFPTGWPATGSPTTANNADVGASQHAASGSSLIVRRNVVR